jgi:hypothetical protein
VEDDWHNAALKAKLKQADKFVVVKRQHGRKYTNGKPRAGVRKADYRYLHYYRSEDKESKAWVAGPGIDYSFCHRRS